MSSFIISFSASAIGCSRPCGPTRYGPMRDCIRAANFRSSSVMYVTSPMTTFSTTNPLMTIGTQLGMLRPQLPTPNFTTPKLGVGVLEVGSFHRSTSPNTGSTEPMIATTSATLCPGMMSGRIARFENDAPRHFMRYGLALPSEMM